MAMKQYTATVKRVEGLRFVAEAGRFTINVDEPVELGGTNTGMTPVQLLLCSLGTCQAITACAYAAYYGIAIDDLRIELEGERDGDPSPSVRPGFQEIRFHYHIRSSAPEARIRQLLQVVEQRCPVGDTLENGVRLGETAYTLTA